MTLNGWLATCLTITEQPEKTHKVGSFIMCLCINMCVLCTHMNTMQVSHPVLAGHRIAKLINLFIGAH